jgi:renalase
MKASRVVAIIGAGMAGSTCARMLQQAGYVVHVFDKSRGPGGRMATRRVEWTDSEGRNWTTRLDHGAVAISAQTSSLRALLNEVERAGGVVQWRPVLAPGSAPWSHPDPQWVSLPDMPALCRTLCAGATTTWSFPVDKVFAVGDGWQLSAGDLTHSVTYDAVVLAVPPAQAAPLLMPIAPSLAARAAEVTMAPCWTMMGISETVTTRHAWDLAQPTSGPLAVIIRNDRRPGRPGFAGQSHWVVHATPAFTTEHLEQAPEAVAAKLQTGLDEYLGQPLRWYQCLVHRWRYAHAPAARINTEPPFWWDAQQRLGVCGDFLAGGGVEGAWLSAQALSAAMTA